LETPHIFADQAVCSQCIQRLVPTEARRERPGRERNHNSENIVTILMFALIAIVLAGACLIGQRWETSAEISKDRDHFLNIIGKPGSGLGLMNDPSIISMAGQMAENQGKIYFQEFFSSPLFLVLATLSFIDVVMIAIFAIRRD